MAASLPLFVHDVQSRARSASRAAPACALSRPHNSSPSATPQSLRKMLSLCTTTLSYTLAPPMPQSRPAPRAVAPIAMAEAHAQVVFLRHGQSLWNEANLFTGWANVELTTLGKNEAAAGATQMWKEGIKIDVAYSSRLKRAQQTLDIVLKITGQEDTPTHKVQLDVEPAPWLAAALQCCTPAHASLMIARLHVPPVHSAGGSTSECTARSRGSTRRRRSQ
eukprot:663859-Prymnesium_polylepis.1